MELLLPYHVLLECLPGLLDFLDTLAVVLANLCDFGQPLQAASKHLQSLSQILLSHIRHICDIVDLLLELRLFLVVRLTSLYLLPRELEVDLLENKHLRCKLIPLCLHPLDLSDQHVALLLQLPQNVFLIGQCLGQHSVQHLFVDIEGLLQVCLLLCELFVLIFQICDLRGKSLYFLLSLLRCSYRLLVPLTLLGRLNGHVSCRSASVGRRRLSCSLFLLSKS